MGNESKGAVSRKIGTALKAVKVVSRTEQEVVFDVPGEIGWVAVRFIAPGSPNNPSPRPWHLVTAGSTHMTPESALIAFVCAYFSPADSPTGRANADRIDGYDRDDLGPSEDR